MHRNLAIFESNCISQTHNHETNSFVNRQELCISKRKTYIYYSFMADYQSVRRVYNAATKKDVLVALQRLD